MRFGAEMRQFRVLALTVSSSWLLAGQGASKTQKRPGTCVPSQTCLQGRDQWIRVQPRQTVCRP